MKAKALRNRSGIDPEVVKTVLLREWARGERDASDTLDLIRERGGDLTLSQYAMMKDHDRTGRDAETILPHASTVGDSWSRERWARWSCG